MITNGGFVKIWKEAVLAYFKVLPLHSHCRAIKTSLRIADLQAEKKTQDLPNVKQEY
jgi:hypothetical protein